MTNEVRAARERLEGADRLFVLTGAGVSAESGVPTFRGGAGAPVWRGMPLEQLSSAETVATNLPLVWEWFDYRRGGVARCRPNAAHLALASAQSGGRLARFTLVTQNVDGLHQDAGSGDVIELHGSLWRARCVGCEAKREMREVSPGERPPRCVSCGSAMRPDVVLFGEMLPEGALAGAAAAAGGCDACLVVGTSALVYPAASLPEIAREAGAFIVEVNPERTALRARCHAALRGPAAEMLPALLGPERSRAGADGLPSSGARAS